MHKKRTTNNDVYACALTKFGVVHSSDPEVVWSTTASEVAGGGAVMARVAGGIIVLWSSVDAGASFVVDSIVVRLIVVGALDGASVVGGFTHGLLHMLSQIAALRVGSSSRIHFCFYNTKNMEILQNQTHKTMHIIHKFILGIALQFSVCVERFLF